MKRYHINPVILILYNFFAPVCIMMQDLSFTRPFYLAVGALVLILETRYIRLLKFIIAFIILYSIYYFSYYLPDSGFKTFCYGTLVMWLGFLPVFIIASVIIIDNTPSEIISALQRLHLPKQIVIALTITIRYFPTFKQEFQTMKEAMRLRGLVPSWLHPIKRFEYFIVPQLFRSSLLAEELTAAGLTKGIDAPIKRTNYLNQSFQLHDYIFSTITLTGMIYGFFV